MVIQVEMFVSVRPASFCSLSHDARHFPAEMTLHRHDANLRRRRPAALDLTSGRACSSSLMVSALTSRVSRGHVRCEGMAGRAG